MKEAKKLEAVTSPGPAKPDAISEIDLLRWSYLTERHARLVMEAGAVQQAINEHRARLTAAYSLSPADSVDGSTGRIVRAPEPAKV